MLKPFDDSGSELDALYSVEPRSNGFDLIVESRGGSDHGPNAARNSEYAPALEQHLTRMGALGMVLDDLQVASSIAMKLPELDRRVSLDKFPLPLALSPATDVRELRHSIGRASAAFGRTDGSDRGNRTKRMRLRMQWPGAAGMTVNAIERMLWRPIAPATDVQPTDDPRELQKRVAQATAHIRAAAKRGTVQPPPGQTTPPKASGTLSRFVRDPNVIAWVLNEAAGNCEICRHAAPFLRAGGEPFLEVHHVRPLGDGGPDTVDNAVACCPNCHRQLHHDRNRDTLRQNAIASIARLRDYPLTATADTVTPATTVIL
ncbi:HNH endonuclease [Mesorhizobium sp. ESP-6-4]|uniref:HNH endonuclease n=1 Tax=Mesorhizobium sp. ESP-6-4 TaxID=2876624 RepID=UPI001CCF7A3D|nr:HNH endonuclease signature motif containing protein [Mesorhizobium sp. ESP-6-4]MBZ9663003.1 HNH endonuclease [Mesorhizobium sp. ESP-6-4]